MFLLLIPDFRQRIGTDDVTVNGCIEQSVQPCQAAVDVAAVEVMAGLDPTLTL